MKPAAEALRERLLDAAIRAPGRPVRSFDAGAYTDADSIRDGLYRQLFNPVRWSAIVTGMIGDGAGRMFECGPGRVLTGLARRAPGGRDLELHAIDSPETLAAALAAAKGETAT
jgi:[acyl-carrier-protein] S-malonyltransferase